MAEGTFEFECLRAELLGVARPNQEDFEKNAERLKQEQEEMEAAGTAVLEEQDESLKSVGGKLDELNSILSSTQQKLNRFKQTACGSLSNIFSRGSVDVPEPSSSTGNRRNTTSLGDDAYTNVGKNTTDINTALNDLDELQEPSNVNITPVIPTEKINQAKADMHKKMTSHLNKLDSLINKTENAEICMTEQTIQMKKMTK